MDLKVELNSFAISSLSVHKGSVALNADNSYGHSSYIACNQQQIERVFHYSRVTVATESIVTILVNRFVHFNCAFRTVHYV